MAGAIAGDRCMWVSGCAGWCDFGGVAILKGCMATVGRVVWRRGLAVQQEYGAMRGPVAPNVNNLGRVGILTCVLSALLILAIGGFMVLGFAFAMSHH